jgi:hypothetical protein
MDLHREIAERVGSELAERDDVLAVLLSGSVCRGEHVATSDVDLLVVITEASSLEVDLAGWSTVSWWSGSRGRKRSGAPVSTARRPRGCIRFWRPRS